MPYSRYRENAERPAPIPYLPGPATHTTGAGRVLDGVRDPTQGCASLAFSCIGPSLVPVLPARCHRCASASCWIGGADNNHDLKIGIEKSLGCQEK